MHRDLQRPKAEIQKNCQRNIKPILKKSLLSGNPKILNTTQKRNKHQPNKMNEYFSSLASNLTGKEIKKVTSLIFLTVFL